MIAASRMPTIVISAPLAHQDRVVTSAFDAPTTKCAIVLMTNDAITAGIPTVKKNGMMGMKPPMAVDTVADSVDRHGWYEPYASFCHSLQPARSDEFVQLATAKAQQHDRLFHSVQDTPGNLRANQFLSHAHTLPQVLRLRPPLTLHPGTSDLNVKRPPEICGHSHGVD